MSARFRGSLLAIVLGVSVVAAPGSAGAYSCREHVDTHVDTHVETLTDLVDRPGSVVHSAASERATSNVDDAGDGFTGDDDGGAAPIIGLLVLVAVLVSGLLAIRRQRQSGRTSKFPRLG